MKKTLIRKFSAATLAICILWVQITPLAYLFPPIGKPSAKNTVRAAGWESISKERLTQAEKKLSPDLLELVRNGKITRKSQEQQGSIGRGRTAKDILQAMGDSEVNLVHVYVTLKENAAIDAADGYLWQVTGRDNEHRLIAAYVGIDELKSLAEQDEVRSVRSVTPMRVHKGSLAAESDTILKTAAVRSAYGASGTGVKIGVISDGVDNLASAKTTGDLPSGVNVLSNTYGGDEGTAMLEIIYDMAPEASLYFHNAEDDLTSFNEAVDELVDAGCKVIVDDIGYDEEAFFENGIIGDHLVSVMQSKDIVFVSAGGNEADVHHQGIFFNDGSGYYDFSHGNSNTRKYLYATLEAGDELDVVLQWDDGFGESANDYDLYAYDDSTGAQLAASEQTQDGDDDPLEIIYYTNESSGTMDIRIEVKSYDALADNTLELFAYPSGNGKMQDYNITAADSIYGHAGAPGVMTVGAISAKDPGYDTIEYYSSRGPLTIIGEGLRAKPEIVGIDEVSVTGAGDFDSPFNGTSAAAPGVAAIVAQLWGAFPNLDGGRIKEAIYGSAVDLGTSGFDYTYGYGRADAQRAYQSLAAVADSEPTVTAIFSDGDGYIKDAETASGVNIDITTAGIVDGSLVQCDIASSGGEKVSYGPINGTIYADRASIASGPLTGLKDGTLFLSCSAQSDAGSPDIQANDTSIKLTAAAAATGNDSELHALLPSGIFDGDIIQCRDSSDPFAVYIVKIVGGKAYIRHIVSLQIFNYYKHLRWENLKQVNSLEAFSLSGWVRVNTGTNGFPRAGDRVWEINGDQTKHWINMTAGQFLTHGGSDEAVYTINQGELDLYRQGSDVISL